jgi:methanethiol S-methyltransferase
VHSLLASLAAKRLARRFAGARGFRFYRLVYNFFGGLSFLPVLAVLAAFPGQMLYRIPSPWFVLALAGQLAALGLLLLGLLQTDPWHFLGVRQLLAQEPEEAPRLVVSGLYSWVRHPLYTAGLLLLWLTPVMTTSVLAFNAALTAYILAGSQLEERRLLAEFGEAYAAYRRRVPRLLPFPRTLPTRADSPPRP